MKNQDHFKKILIVLSLCVFGLFVVIYFVFADIKQKNENISTLENDLSLKTKQQQYLVSMQRTVKNADSDISRINNSIIGAGEDVQFIESLESIAKNNGLTINIDSLVFEDSTLPKSSSMTTLKVRAKTSGGWLGTYKFLGQIESMPLKIKINNFGFTNTVDETNAKVWQSIFEISILKYK